MAGWFSFEPSHQKTWGRVPERYVPSMAAADAARMPTIAAIERWLEHAGFAVGEARRVLCNKKLSLADEERQLLIEASLRYAFIDSRELDEGLRLMRADGEAHRGEWIDPRPTYFVVASKPTGHTVGAVSRGS